MNSPTKRQLLDDYSFPDWGKDILRTSERLDPVDYLNVLECLAREARERHESILRSVGASLDRDYRRLKRRVRGT